MRKVKIALNKSKAEKTAVLAVAVNAPKSARMEFRMSLRIPTRDAINVPTDDDTEVISGSIMGYVRLLVRVSRRGK